MSSTDLTKPKRMSSHIAPPIWRLNGELTASEIAILVHIATHLKNLRDDKGFYNLYREVVERHKKSVKKNKNYGVGASMYVSYRAADLKGFGTGRGRAHNDELKKALDRLQNVTINGEVNGVYWGTVLIADYDLDKHSQRVGFDIPIRAIDEVFWAPNYTSVDIGLIHALPVKAQLLYTKLCDWGNAGKWNTYTIPLDKLHEIFRTTGKYPRFSNFRVWVLEPSFKRLENVFVFKRPDKHNKKYPFEILKKGRKIIGIKVQWRWKTGQELEQKKQSENLPHPPAYPLGTETRSQREANFTKVWEGLTSEEQELQKSLLGYPLSPAYIDAINRGKASLEAWYANEYFERIYKGCKSWFSLKEDRNTNTDYPRFHHEVVG